jgi:Tfp pilus assembly protein PilF
MTIRPHSLRRAVALLLTAVCAGTDLGCRALPPSLTNSERAPTTVADRQEADAPPTTPNDSYSACLTTAREMEAHGKPAAAIEQYERARKHAPTEPGIAARLAVLYDRQGEPDRAAREYSLALKEDPTNADLWNDCAYFQLQRAEFVDAEISVRRALTLDPDHKRAWVTRGLVEAELERYDDAYTSFTRAVSPAAAHNNLGIILARQGKPELAGKHITEARRLDPTQKQPASVAQAVEARKPEQPISPHAIKRS